MAPDSLDLQHYEAMHYCKDGQWEKAEPLVLSVLAAEFVNNGDNSSVNVGTSFQIASIGDFNGDAIDDILWRNNTGEIFDFLGKSNGGFMNNGDNSFVSVVNTTHVQDPFL